MRARRKSSRHSADRLRPTILDDLDDPVTLKNLFCRRDDLTNEASVETFFVSRLLADLGYSDRQIKTKASISTLTVARGHRRIRYKPDYVLVVNRQPRCVIDAKSPDESLDDWVEQCSGYCLALNRKYPNSDPVRFFILSNGIETRLYEWNKEDPVLVLQFPDFQWGNQKYEQLKRQLHPSAIGTTTVEAAVTDSTFELRRPTPERARQLFALCHKAIWQSEVGSPAFAFMEFVKVMFVKLWADRHLRDSSETKSFFASGEKSIQLPAASVLFSVAWLEQREREGTPNPLDTILFAKLRDEIEQSIEFRKKKRLFDKGEHINLRPDTIKDVVRRLEHFDMFGIDEDLNGRLFETFLSATMRGRELGQFFTPRSVVKMMTRLADLKVDRNHRDKVIDGCCGSGGFLIEALTMMRNSIRENASLTNTERVDLLESVCNECLYGIDYGKDPPLARIARINMYLHGDGGSRIYYADGLDKNLDSTREKDSEVVQNVEELRGYLSEPEPVLFDVVLSNPPFSMIKSRKNDTEKEILEQYVLAQRKPGTSQLRNSLRSSVMFIERYTDLLKPGGKLITVIDESILAGPEYGFVRTFIKERFLVRAIISIHGDAFRRQGSRIKTSVLMLEKKRDLNEEQPPCFTFFSTRLGVDDLTPRASDADIAEARELAAQETEEILAGYQKYLAGQITEHVIPAANLSDTFDLKSCVPLSGRMAARWRAEGIDVKPLKELVTLVESPVNPSLTPDEVFRLVKVGYNGRCQVEAVKAGKAIKYEKMHRVKAGQLVFSTIRAVNGAIGVVPEDLDGALVSESYTVFECGTPKDTAYLWAVLRSHEIRADIQSASTGASRYYSYWPEIGEVLIPWIAEDKRHEIGGQFIATWELERALRAKRTQANALIEGLGVESQDSKRRWEASRPPT